MSDLPPIPLILRTRLAHATLQAIADACGADLLHIKGAAVDPSLLPTRPDAHADATVELVRPAHLKRFQAALKRYGWQRKTRLYSGGAVEHSEDWWHPELGSVDLHVRFPGIQLRRDQAFHELWNERHSLDLAHRPCPVPSVDAQRLLLLLHAARNGALGPADVRLAWSSATPTEQGRVQALAVRLRAEVALAAATGQLEDYADRAEYALWRIALLTEPDAFEAWLAHVKAAPSWRDRARALIYPLSLKADRLDVTLQRPATAHEVLRRHCGRFRQGVAGLLIVARRSVAAFPGRGIGVASPPAMYEGGSVPTPAAPSPRDRNPRGKSGETEMKYAFLILAHTDPQQLTRLVRALNDNRFDIYIHLDSKAEWNSYQEVLRAAPSSTVVFLDKRRDIRWGGITMVRAMIDLYRHASQNGCYERYTMLSGLDFPLLTTNGIAEYFANNGNHELIMGNPLIGDGVKKVSTYNFLELRSRYLRAATRLVLRHLPVKSSRVLIDGQRYPVYFAPQWHSLTANCVTWILETLDTHPHLWRYFRFSYAPDELLIPTLVFNSPFKAATLGSGLPPETHYNEKCATHYIDYGRTVRVLTANDFEALIHSGKPFCRKLQTGPSDQLVARLTEHQRSAS